MSEPVRGVVVCHGKLAAALVGAVERISGVTGALLPVSNDDCDRGRLGDRIAAAIDGAPSVLFVDLPMGSCLMAAVRRLHEHHDAPVVTGVNLAMLVDFVFHRETTPEEAAARAAETGAAAIRMPT